MTAPGDPRSLSGLLTPEAVRKRAHELLALAEAGEAAHFRLSPDRLAETADLVAEVTRAAYPDLQVPLHSRWRHFELGQRDLWAELGAALAPADGDARARTRFELAIVSVLLDGGAGAGWRYRDAATGLTLARSEGLAVASLRMFQAGGVGQTPGRADAEGLAAVGAETLAHHFQAGPGNPLVGLEARAALLQALGREIARQPDIFGTGEACRLGGLYDHLKQGAGAGTEEGLPARDILIAILSTLNGVWPSGLHLAGTALGDVGRHQLIRRDDASDGLVPFHKLSQWLAYSLIEPLEEAGIRVTALDRLTGLPEYRNGGLLLDTGVLVPRAAQALGRRYEAGDEFVVEWRALTVALLDRLAGLVRERLSRSEAELPLAAVLEGGTWAAGRRLAQERRDGRPPFEIASDGTVF